MDEVLIYLFFWGALISAIIGWGQDRAGLKVLALILCLSGGSCWWNYQKERDLIKKRLAIESKYSLYQFDINHSGYISFTGVGHDHCGSSYCDCPISRAELEAAEMNYCSCTHQTNWHH